MRARLLPLYGRGETEGMIRVVWQHLKGWQPVDVVLHGADEAGEYVVAEIGSVVSRVAAGEPLQYVLGEARFFGLQFRVTPATLIPRPETEGLVQMVLDDAGDRADLRVLDAGTGSGAIAVALARHLPFPQVTALDISDAALKVAAGNARRLNVKVDFVRADIFSWHPRRESLDIVVSNPPYVLESERAGMERNVLGHEPATAIFAPADNPVGFYEAIAAVARDGLVRGGHLYFELNPLTAGRVADAVEALGFGGVELSRDIHGRIRYLKATNSSL